MDKRTAASLDTLEHDLSLLETEGDLLRRASYWLTKYLNCSFVLFYAEQKNSPVGQVKYYGEAQKSLVHLPDVVNERVRYAPETKGLLVHSGGELSVPVVYGELVFGYLFVGRHSDGSKYSSEQMQVLGPVSRIVHNALVSLEAEKALEEKDKLRNAMNRYISPEVVDLVAGTAEDSLYKGELVNASVLYSCLPASALMDESKSVSVQLKTLNTYLNEMTQVILSLGGTISRYDGASILAFFGAMKPLPDHAVRCCLAALRMKRMEGIINEQFEKEGLVSKPFASHIGINTGSMVAGNIGSLGRMDFTVVGKNVEHVFEIVHASERIHTSRNILLGHDTRELVYKCFRISIAREARSFVEPHIFPLYELEDVNPGTIPLYTNFLVEGPLPVPKSDGIAEI